MVCLLQNVKDKHAVPGCAMCVCVCRDVLYVCVHRKDWRESGELSVLVHSLASPMPLSTDDCVWKQPLWLIAGTLVS